MLKIIKSQLWLNEKKQRLVEHMAGQGLVEYALILVLVTIVVIGVLALDCASLFL